MDKDQVNIKYTDSGLKELEKFKADQVNKLEEYLLKERYVIGDDEIEITGSDIKEFQDNIRIVSRRKPFKSTTIRLASYLYIFIGITTTIVGFTYDFFKTFIETNQEQAMISLMGLAITFVGVFFLFYLKLREKRYSEEEKRSSTQHSRQAS